MDARLFYGAGPFGSAPIDELSCVRLVRGEELSPHGYLPRGTSGTVVAVHGGGEAYTIEFEEPFHTLVILEATKVEIIPGATRDDIIAATGKSDG